MVLPYTNDDPIACRKLEDAGAAAVMPLGAPIGSGLGVQNPNNIVLVKEAAGVPVIVDAGVGTASDAAIRDGAGHRRRAHEHRHRRRGRPGWHGRGDELAVLAGRLAHLSGRIPRKRYATASSPLEGVIGS